MHILNHAVTGCWMKKKSFLCYLVCYLFQILPNTLVLLQHPKNIQKWISSITTSLWVFRKKTPWSQQWHYHRCFFAVVNFPNCLSAMCKVFPAIQYLEYIPAKKRKLKVVFQVISKLAVRTFICLKGIRQSSQTWWRKKQNYSHVRPIIKSR